VAVDFELQSGDRVSIVGETDDGMIQALATVLGPTAPDWYAGRLDDGSDVEFRIDQVEEVLGGQGYELAGFMDWFKKKPKSPESRSLIPIEEVPTLYVSPTGVAKYEEPPKKKGFLAPIRESVKELFTQQPEGQTLWEKLKSGFASIVPAAPTTPAPYVKPPSLFAQFMPPETSLAPVVEKITSLMPPPGPTPLAPYVEKAAELFQHVEPSAAPVPYEEKVAKQQELFKGMFEESKPEEDLSKMFEAFPEGEKKKKKKQVEAPEDIRAFPKNQVVTPETVDVPETVYEHGREDMAIKPLPMPERGPRKVFPDVMDIARGLVGFYNQGRELFPRKFFEAMKEESEAFRAEGDRNEPILKIPFETIGLHDGHPDPFEGMSIFLQIPWEEFRKRAVVEDMGDGNEEWVDVNDITEEIMYPAMDLINQAFRAIKPEDVPGEFMVEYSDDCGCLHIYYVDQLRALTMEEQEYMDYYGRLPTGGLESGEGEEEEVEEEGEAEAPKRVPKKKAKKKAKKKGSRK